jgi:hypothetical protein
MMDETNIKAEIKNKAEVWNTESRNNFRLLISNCKSDEFPPRKTRKKG